MKQWEVIVGLGTGQFGPFRANFQAAYNVQAETYEQALDLGCERAREAGHDTIKSAQARRRYKYEITLRGRDDKRRRETFVIHATDERHAIQYLTYRTKATRFAGWFSSSKADAVVRVVQKD